MVRGQYFRRQIKDIPLAKRWQADRFSYPEEADVVIASVFI